MSELNPTVTNGSKRVVVTKELPGTHWQEVLVAADCRIEVVPGTEILSKEQIKTLIGNQCDGAIGQLTEALSRGSVMHLFSMVYLYFF